jgi:lipopolysaccharide/colanic/teichoic acid biosynthesis glycosyltransferase
MKPEAVKEKVAPPLTDSASLPRPVPAPGPSHVVFFPTPKRSFYALKGKRLSSLLFSIGMIVALSPVLLLTFLAVAIDQKSLRLTIYTQERVGWNKKHFWIYKFRSMVATAESNGPQFSNGKSDARITKLGRFIRKFRLDELPQLFNVLKGDMAMIGPRPERPVFHEKIEVSLPAFGRRLEVRPGITGLAQVSNGYVGSDIKGHQAKLEADLHYIRDLSVWTDVKIAAKTVGCVVRGEGI